MLHPARVAIVGLPNVGKSTLANQLFGQQRSITAAIPGTTRDWVGEFADIDGLPIMLLDTPGQRTSSDLVEQSAIASSHSIIATADLVIVVLDPTQPEVVQLALVQSYEKCITVLNRSDLAPSRFQVDVTTVATTGVGIDQLRRAVRDRFCSGETTVDQPHCWTVQQFRALKVATHEPRPRASTVQGLFE
jgi:tRNA modification GTPase